ncbi:hypothetical protein [Lutibacter flavus]|uniref:Uncharacterized protein n=1 Tax=Lutibacter flavus TaxID=691689 RepID=A0A238VS29_9FLAO|nr:hypothetical protein [Lutibacter flavus]SNR37105.1 hypothetical protein SAMN04488111_0961 [Lutibacter flavus]
MTLNDFNLLNECDRKATVFKDGIFIGLHQNENEYITCFMIDHFFSELVYDKDMQEIIEVRSSKMLPSKFL